MASEGYCPICLDTWDRAACAMPCKHRFCFGCIQRWVGIRPRCPICKRKVSSICQMLPGDTSEEFPRRPPVASRKSIMARQQWNPYGGLMSEHPSTWGVFFRTCPDLSGFPERWEGNLVVRTSSTGFQEGCKDNLVASISPTASSGGSPVPRPAPSSSTAPEGTEETQASLTTALRGTPSCPHSILTPIPEEQEELKEEPEETVAGASAASQGKGSSFWGPQPSVENVTISEGSAASAKKRFMGGLHPYAQEFFFRIGPDLLQLLQPWLHQELEHILGEEHSQVIMLEDMILNVLPILGLHEELLIEKLQPNLQSHTTAFVQRLIGFTVEQCRRAAHHLLLHGDSPAARGLEDSPGEVICSSVFMRWWDRSSVTSTHWAACQERWEGNLMARTSSTGFQKRWEDDLLANTALTGFLERQVGNLVARTSCSSFQERWEGNLVASTRPTDFQEGCEDNLMTSISPTASPGGSLVPRPAPSNSTAPEGTEGSQASLTTALQGTPSCPLSILTPTPEEQEELKEEPQKTVAGASVASQGRGSSSWGPQPSVQRKVTSSEDSAAPTK